MKLKILFLLCLLSVACYATNPAYANSGSCGTGGVTCSFSLAVTAGNLLITNCGNTVTTTTCTISDTVNTYTALPGFSPITDYPRMDVSIATAATTATLTILCTWSSSSGWQTCGVEVVSGTNLGIDRIAGFPNTTASTEFTGTTNLTRSANELLVGLFIINSSGYTINAGTGYTLDTSNGAVGDSSAIIHKLVSSTGTYQGSVNLTGSGNVQSSNAVLLSIADLTTLVNPVYGFADASTCNITTSPCTTKWAPLGVTAGDVLLVTVSNSLSGAHTFSVSDSDSNSYSAVASAWSGTQPNSGMFQSFIATAAHTVSSLIFTCSTTSVNAQGCIGAHYVNMGNAITVDQIATNLTTASQVCSGGGYTLSVGPTATTTKSNEVVVGLFLTTTNGPLIAAGSGFTFAAGQGNGFSMYQMLENKLVTSKGTQTATAVSTTANNCVPIGVVLTLGLFDAGGNRHHVISQ